MSTSSIYVIKISTKRQVYFTVGIVETGSFRIGIILVLSDAPIYIYIYICINIQIPRHCPKHTSDHLYQSDIAKLSIDQLETAGPKRANFNVILPKNHVRFRHWQRHLHRRSRTTSRRQHPAPGRTQVCGISARLQPEQHLHLSVSPFQHSCMYGQLIGLARCRSQMASTLLVPEYSLAVDLRHLQSVEPELANILAIKPNEYLPWVPY